MMHRDALSTNTVFGDDDDAMLMIKIIKPAREARGPKGPARWER